MFGIKRGGGAIKKMQVLLHSEVSCYSWKGTRLTVDKNSFCAVLPRPALCASPHAGWFLQSTLVLYTPPDGMGHLPNHLPSSLPEGARQAFPHTLAKHKFP
ncbi:rCG60863, isoform CRA_b [Rattus norvegicus]|uniref:RCG60863, isoform CRA_b n=1 Tax=Rattus norvegicus TaxID=10116 RepID=A6JKL8_RAT|nr:rCG60863, isoform CRA_b [Rattus norvegicus]